MRKTGNRCAIQALESRQLLSAVALDLNFGVQGRIVTDFSASSDVLEDANLQGDGKLLILSSGDGSLAASNPYLARYNPDGTADDTFAPQGRFALPRQGISTYYKFMHVLADGKLLLAGSSLYNSGVQYYMRFLFVRLNPDLSPDPSFGTAGIVTSDLTMPDFVHRFSFAMLPDGKILAGGQVGDQTAYSDAAIWRFNSDGTLDQTFASGGAARFNYNIPRQSMDSLLVNPDGSFFALTAKGEAKFTENGAIDTSFANQGYLPQGVTLKRVLGDGRLLGVQRLLTTPDTTGGFLSDIVVSRWNSNGAPDGSFGNNGATRIDFAPYEQPYDLNMDSSGRILLSAGAQKFSMPARFALARLLPDGQMDSSFGPGGKYLDEFGVAPFFILPTIDNKIYAAGYGPAQGSDISITRYVPDAPINFSIQTPSLVDEGDMFTVNAGGSSYDNGQIVRYEWDAGYDGWNFHTDAEGLSANLGAADDPTTIVALRVTTSDGLRAQALASVQTLNVPPIANAGPDQVVLANARMGVQVRSDDVVPETGTLTVDWGDGSPPSGIVFDTPTNPMMTTLFHTYQKSGTYTFTLTADDGDGGISTDTAIIRAVDIVANVFQDANGDGVNNVGEAGFPGVTIWVDLNDNGTQDPGEPSDLTDSSGYVYFDVPAGNYKLRMQVPPGWQRSFSDPNFRGDYWTAPVPLRLDNRPFMGLTQKAGVTGAVYNDLNGNGVRDAGEPAVSGVKVSGINSSQALTASDGFYRLRGLPAAQFLVKVTPPTGWIQTFPGALTSQVVSADPGQTIDHIDFGIRQIAGATASGLIFSDVNGNGVFDVGEPRYATNNFWYKIPIWLDADNDGVLDLNEQRIALGSSGNWSLSGLPAGTYTFRLMPRPLFAQTWPSNSAGITVTLADGQAVQNLNFGFQKLDTQPPQLLNIAFRYDQTPNAIEMDFSEDVYLETWPLKVTLGGNQVTFDPQYWDYGVYDKLRLIPRNGPLVADGDYQVTLIPGVITDMADNPLPPMPNWSFFALKGDLNRDRQVSIDDFITLASNFGKTNATYADGDLNYDGQVTISDFIDLSSNFNKTLSPPAVAAPPQPAAAIEISSPAAALSDVLATNAPRKVVQAKPALVVPRHAKHHRRLSHRH